MHPARRIASFLLLLVWLPALLHCRLEAAGLLFGEECCQKVPAKPDRCADDSCEVAEGEFTKPAPLIVAAPLPALGSALWYADWVRVSLQGAAPPAPAISDQATAPPEIPRTWLFIARAAAEPGAPSLLG